MQDAEPLMPPEKPQFEMLCLANYVEVQNGMLYMVGGGWTEHRRVPVLPNGEKTASRMSIAIMVKVPWAETNRKQRFVVEITDLDASVQLMKVDGEFNTGRPGNLPPGSAQYISMAVNSDIVFPQAGTYMLRGTLNGDSASARTWEFRVFDIAAPNSH
jgi:hypothetical protein